VILFWPGGYGTAWEVFETLSKISTKHLRRHRTKAIFVHREYWEPLFRFVDHMRQFGTINSYGDRIKIPGVDDQLPDEAYIAEVVDSPEEAFAKTRAFVEDLYQRNQLTLRSD
jgi:predicted Rossmann-fold nucleotide-binding protein